MRHNIIRSKFRNSRIKEHYRLKSEIDIYISNDIDLRRHFHIRLKTALEFDLVIMRQIFGHSLF